MLLIHGEFSMKTVTAFEFFNQDLFTNFNVSYMPGIKVSDIESSFVVVNLDTAEAYVYHD